MRNILLLHGANLNKLGKRDANHYGHLSLKNIENITGEEALKHQLNVIAFQSNHEGDLIDKIQSSSECLGIIINPGAFSHYSYAIHDALLDSQLPIIEVHLSDITQREPWRNHSVTASACLSMITGLGERGYREAVNLLAEYLNQ